VILSLRDEVFECFKKCIDIKDFAVHNVEQLEYCVEFERGEKLGEIAKLLVHPIRNYITKHGTGVLGKVNLNEVKLRSGTTSVSKDELCVVNVSHKKKTIKVTIVVAIQMKGDEYVSNQI